MQKVMKINKFVELVKIIQFVLFYGWLLNG